MIELASVIRDLREELDGAIRAADGEALRFELGPIELEVSVALERTGRGRTRVRFWVLESGADAKVGRVSTQRIKLTLQPALVGASKPPYVSGPPAAHER